MNISQQNLKRIDEVIIDLYGSELQKFQSKMSNLTLFSELGYQKFDIDEKKYDFENEYFAFVKRILFSNDDFTDNFYRRDFDDSQIRLFNNSHYFYQNPGEVGNKLLSNFLLSISKDIEKEIGSCFRIINVRASAAKRKMSFGPTKMHADLGPRFLRKIMIYPQPMNKSNGSLEIITRKGQKIRFNSDSPQAILLDSSICKHRGISPYIMKLRPMIEVTIAPSEKNDLTLMYEGHQSRDYKFQKKNFPIKFNKTRNLLIKKVSSNDFGQNVPTDEERLKIMIRNNKKKSFIYRIFHNCWKLRSFLFFEKINQRFFLRETCHRYWYNVTRNINLGGGFKFNYISWLNLDETNERSIHSLIDLSDVIALPISSGTIKKVYSSHFFEHIPDKGVSKLLIESRRILERKGVLILKIPDFELALKKVKKNNLSFFRGGLGPFVKTWNSKNVQINSQNAASFLFSSYWNKDYGNPFQRSNRVRGGDPYFGPAVMKSDELKQMFSSNDIHGISRKLTERIETYKDFGGFNHQNAWSKKQLMQIVENAGFKVISQNKFFIVLRFLNIPRLFELFSWSQYLYAIPENSKTKIKNL